MSDGIVMRGPGLQIFCGPGLFLPENPILFFFISCIISVTNSLLEIIFRVGNETRLYKWKREQASEIARPVPAGVKIHVDSLL